MPRLLGGGHVSAHSRVKRERRERCSDEGRTGRCMYQAGMHGPLHATVAARPLTAPAAWAGRATRRPLASGAALATARACGTSAAVGRAAGGRVVPPPPAAPPDQSPAAALHSAAPAAQRPGPAQKAGGCGWSGLAALASPFLPCAGTHASQRVSHGLPLFMGLALRPGDGLSASGQPTALSPSSRWLHPAQLCGRHADWVCRAIGAGERSMPPPPAWRRRRALASFAPAPTADLPCNAGCYTLAKLHFVEGGSLRRSKGSCKFLESGASQAGAAAALHPACTAGRVIAACARSLTGPRPA